MAIRLNVGDLEENKADFAPLDSADYLTPSETTSNLGNGLLSIGSLLLLTDFAE